ncbi:MAG: hypothetical protein AAFR02_12545, partial [Pseudomonadota bacterium]
MTNLTKILAALAAFALVSPSYASTPNVAFTSFSYGHTAKPKSPGDILNDIIRSSTLKHVSAEAMQTKFGVPSQVTKELWSLAEKDPAFKKRGEEQSIFIPAPAGYIACKVVVNNVSFNASHMDVKVLRGNVKNRGYHNGVSVYSWAKIKGIGGKQQWANFDVDVMWARAGLERELGCS